MELVPEPDYENVVFIDEYPELVKRREVRLALGGLRRIVNSDPSVLIFPDLFAAEDTPDGAA